MYKLSDKIDQLNIVPLGIKVNKDNLTDELAKKILKFDPRYDKYIIKKEKKASGERARDKDGEFKADDKSTPDKNEAYDDGKTPEKKSTKK